MIQTKFIVLCCSFSGVFRSCLGGLGSLLLVAISVVSLGAQTAALTSSTALLNPAGGTAVFSFVSTFTGSALFSLTATIPANWRYVSGQGEPALTPDRNAENSLSWLNFSPSPGPVAFTFSLSYPAGLTTALVTSTFTLRQNSQRIELVLAPVVLGGVPVITGQPVSQTADAGANVTLSVVAASGGALTYQWRKDGATLPAATAAALMLANLAGSDAGVYSVVVTGAAGSTTSASATLTVRPPLYAGVWLGAVGSAPGSPFALFVREDRTGVLFFGEEIPCVIGVDGRCQVTRSFSAGSRFPGVNTTQVFDLVLTGVGTLGGAVTETGPVPGVFSLAGNRDAGAGPTRALAGLYRGGAINSAAGASFVVNSVGQAFMLVTAPTFSESGLGLVDPAGRITLTTLANAAVTGSLSAATATLSASVTTVPGARLELVGANETRVGREKLLNIATRGAVGASAGAMIAGFVLRGDTPKAVMIRAIGPALAGFGVAGALTAPRLELFRADTSLATNTGWGSSPATAAAAAGAGAFALAPNSRDAVILTSLPPGAYTAVVSGEGGAAGVALVEVYDVSENTLPAQKVVNIASRGFAGSGDTTLTAGFVISGSVLKRVLIRGVGPTLAAFGVAGTLVDPQLRLIDRPGATVATNDDWGAPTSAAAATATQVSAAAAVVGAFALAPESKDAALLVHLTPGPYTVQLSGAEATTGAALIEVYEVP